MSQSNHPSGCERPRAVLGDQAAAGSHSTGLQTDLRRKSSSDSRQQMEEETLGHGSFPACCGKFQSSNPSLLSTSNVALGFISFFPLGLGFLLCDRETVTLPVPTHQRSLNPAKPRADGNEIYSAQQLLPDFCCEGFRARPVSWCKGD